MLQSSIIILIKILPLVIIDFKKYYNSLCPSSKRIRTDNILTHRHVEESYWLQKELQLIMFITSTSKSIETVFDSPPCWLKGWKFGNCESWGSSDFTCSGGFEYFSWKGVESLVSRTSLTISLIVVICGGGGELSVQHFLIKTSHRSAQYKPFNVFSVTRNIFSFKRLQYFNTKKIDIFRPTNTLKIT